MPSRKKKNNSKKKLKLFGLLILLIGLFLGGKFLYKKARFYYAMYLVEERAANLTNTTYERFRINRIISTHSDKTFGIDISHYQDFMVFDSLFLVNKTIPIDFVVLRATMGDDGIDNKFKNYWKELDKHEFIRGAYHYYRPWEKPEKQAKLFLKRIDLKSGDLRPVLDIEKIGKNQSKEKLVKDLKIWLDLVEKEYDTKPIIYTYYYFYRDYLQGEFDDYPLWIANYNNVTNPTKSTDWQMWQFSENGILPGVPHKVDLNIFNGSLEQMKKYTLQ